MAPKNKNEDRIRSLTQMYYSRSDVQKAIFTFASDREVVPRYFEGFGKRPDVLQYKGDIFELVKKGATSLHCSEELWHNPLSIVTGMNPKELNKLRKGWDLLLDIDSKYLDYSKIMVQLILKLFKFHGVKNFGIKFSGSKGFHILVPWKAFPEEINGVMASDMFPEWPRIVTKYIIETIKNDLIEKITDLTRDSTSKYVKDFQAPKEVMPDLILVSSRHLFRMPYSLHEKTSLVSAVLLPEEINGFQPRDADPIKVKIKDFMPNSKNEEASELLREALDWYKNKVPEENFENSEKKRGNFKPIKVSNMSENFLPPAIKKILQGIKGDGRKRALFILLNFLRALDLDRSVLEKKLYEWNNKNEIPLQEGYLKAQLSWSYRNKPMPPPNYDKDHYSALGIIPTDEEKRFKNPVSFMAKKSWSNEENKKNKKTKNQR